MSAVRALVLTLVLMAAVVLQVAVFSALSFEGVVPNLALLVVVAAALVRGPEFAAALGFLGGLAIDLAPPADHVAGRWALALVVVGYLAGRVRPDGGTSAVTALLTVASCSFVGTSVFALSGMLLHDPAIPVGEALGVDPGRGAVRRAGHAVRAAAADAALPPPPAAPGRVLMPSTTPGGTGRPRTSAATKSRLRLVVVQALVLSLFVTLFARLWYMQVLGGEAYQAQAAEQSVRELVVQPARGLIVDDMGRPLVANRTSWVVSLDRTMLAKMGDGQQDRLLRRLSRAVHVPGRKIRARTLLCGQPGAVSGTCWNGSPYQPVPVAEDVPQQTAVSIMEQGEDFPSVLVDPANVRSYPSPYGINAAHLLGYLSPITSDELDEARAEDDTSLHGASVVGRAGLEKEYDRFLRGQPGYKRVAVDSMGRVLGDSGEDQGRAGDTLVTSIDARVQGVVEHQLSQTISTARRTFDKVTGRNYVADSGSVVVLDAQNGRVVAMAGAPTYDPDIWTGGITSKQLRRLYSEKARYPLLFRATQGQFAPGSTWKPIMTTGALDNGFSESTRLDCSSGFQVGNRWFKNYESASFGFIGFDKALQISCDTFFYRVGYDLWRRYGTDKSDVNAKDPLVRTAKLFGFGRPTGIDIPGEASGRIADRTWKREYWEANKAYYCKVAKKPGTDFLHLFAREFCAEGYQYRAGDAVNFVIGQGDTLVTPLQSARAYAALANGGTLYEPRVAKAIVAPDGRVIRRIAPRKVGHVKVSDRSLRYVDTALLGTAKTGTTAWKFVDFPLDKVHIRSKTGSAEVHGQAEHVVGGVVRQEVRGDDDGHPGRHRLGHLRPGGAQDLGGAVRRQGDRGPPEQGRPAGRRDPHGPPRVREGRRDPAAAVRHRAAREPAPAGGTPMSVVATRPRTARVETTTRVRAARLDWVLMLAAAVLLAVGALLVWSATSARSGLAADDPTAYLKKQLVNIAIGVVLGVMVAATDHRWVRILAPLVYVASVVGLLLVLVMGSTINGSRSWIQVGGMSIQPAEFAKLAVVIGMALLVAERAEGALQHHLALGGRQHRRARHARDRGPPGGAHPAPARPRARCWCSARRSSGSSRSRGPAAPGWPGSSREPSRPPRWPSSCTCSRPTSSTGSWRSPTPTSTPAAPATTPRRPGSRSATAGSSARACSAGRRPTPASSPSSTPTSSSPSQGRSSAWSGPRSSSGCSASCCGGRCGSPCGPTTCSAGSPRPVSPAGSGSRRSRTSACAWGSCP